jgi:CheY-like chemotaxis protein
MLDKPFPIGKDDVKYNAQSQEVSLKREKFDELIKYISELTAEAEEADHARAAAQYRQRRASASNTILEQVLLGLAAGSKAIREWVDEHSIKKLSERTGIPYATCHRLVTERLGNSKLSIKDLVTMLSKVAERPARELAPLGSVIFVGPEKTWNTALDNMRGARMNVHQAKSGSQALRMLKKVQPGMIVIDVSMPEFKGEELLELSRQKGPIVLVNTGDEHKLGEIADKVSRLASGSQGLGAETEWMAQTEK